AAGPATSTPSARTRVDRIRAIEKFIGVGTSSPVLRETGGSASRGPPATRAGPTDSALVVRPRWSGPLVRLDRYDPAGPTPPVRPLGRRGHRPWFRRFRAGSMVDGGTQVEPESRPSFALRIHPDVKPVLVRDALHDGQPHARALASRREERVEQLVRRGWIDGGAVLFDGQLGPGGGALQDHAPLSSGAAGLNGVAHQVPKQLPGWLPVRADPDAIRRPRVDDAHVRDAPPRSRGELHDLTRQGRHVDGAELGLPRAGQIQHVADQLVQADRKSVV